MSSTGTAQEVICRGRPQHPHHPQHVTRLLNRAAGDANNFLHTNGATAKALPPGRPNQHRERAAPASGGSSDRDQGVARRPIVVNGVMYVTTSFSKSMRPTPDRRACGTKAGARTDHDLLLRAQQSRRRDTGQGPLATLDAKLVARCPRHQGLVDHITTPARLRETMARPWSKAKC